MAVITESATMIFGEPPIPISFKKVLGPPTYDATNGYVVTIEEQPYVAMLLFPELIEGADGSIILPKAERAVDEHGNPLPNQFVLTFDKIIYDGTNVTKAPLDNGSTALNGVYIKMIVIGRLNHRVISPE